LLGGAGRGNCKVPYLGMGDGSTGVKSSPIGGTKENHEARILSVGEYRENPKWGKSSLGGGG